MDSHGGAFAVAGHQGYCFYPHAALLSLGDATPRFSAADLANLLGPSNSEKIHNIALAGCNEEGALHSSVLRRYFVNATNVIYMEAGRRAYKPMLYQALTRNSDSIKPLYGRLRPVTDGRLECRLHCGFANVRYHR